MDTVNFIRYLIALMLIVAVPAAIAFWLLVHPFAGFWRAIGTGRAYATLCSAVAAVMGAAVMLRRPLLSVDFGASLPLTAVGILFLFLSGWLLLTLRKKLTLRVLVGIPEISRDAGKGSLITDGIYARVRHPRYSQMTLALLGYALIANFAAAYGAFVVWCIGIFFVTVLEERELEHRFGAEFRAYREKVPRFVPRLR